MDHTNGEEQSPLPIDFDGSLDPGRLPNVTLGNNSLMSSQCDLHVPGLGAGRRSPVKTIKEYNQQVSDLTKENFNLKLRIYHLEERVERQFGSEQDVFKTNIELSIMVDHLNEELAEKQIYLVKAAEAVSTMTVNHQQAEEAIKKQCVADHKQELDELKAALDKALQDCERSQKHAEDAAREVESMENEQGLAVRNNKDLSEKMKVAQSHIDSLEKKLKDSDGMVYGLKNEVSNLQKQLERKNRDMTRLSVCFDDKSLIDTTILEPQHLQDKYEDQIEEVEKLKKNILDLQDELGTKDDKIKGMKKELEEKLKEVDDKTLALAKCQKTIGGLMNKIRDINKKTEDKDKKVKNLESDIIGLRHSLENAAKEKSQLINDSTMVEETNDYLRHRVDEYKIMAEGFMQNLGKKEGEISGFQDQLKKAMEALTNSGIAVEELQMQLKKERAEFENKLRNQAIMFEECKGQDSDVIALKQQMAELKKVMADQNVTMLELQRELSGVERQNKKLRDREGDLLDEMDGHRRKMLLLEREIHSLKLELERREMRIGNLQTNTVHVQAPNQMGTKLDVNVQLLPINVMEDMRLLVDNLRQELLTIKVLQNSLQGLMANGSGSGAEFDSVHKIYQQLEEDLAKNSQLYRHLLTSVQARSPGKVGSNATPIQHFDEGDKLMADQTDGSAPPPSSPIDHTDSLVDETLSGVRDDNNDLTGNKLNISDLEHTAMRDGSKLSRSSAVKPSLTSISLEQNHSLTDDAKEGNQRHPDSNSFRHFFNPQRQSGELLYISDSKVDNEAEYCATSPDQRSIIQGQGGIPPQDDLIDLFSDPQSQGRISCNLSRVSDHGNLSQSSAMGRESEDFHDSFRNVTRRSDIFSDRFSNVSARSCTGSVDIYPNNRTKGNHSDEVLRGKDGRNSRLSKESGGTENRQCNGLDSGYTHGPDVVKSTIGPRKREDEQTSGNDDIPVRQGKDTQEWRSCWEDSIGAPNGQAQTSPSDDGRNVNNSGMASRLLSPPNNRAETLHSPHNSNTTAPGRNNQMAQLQASLMEALRQKQEADAEIQALQDKLESTENTVRHLSRKMKSYYNTMEQAGINPPLKRRSSSEISLGQIDAQKQGQFYRGSQDSNKDETCQLSQDNASLEKGRDANVLMSPSKVLRCDKRILSPTSTIRSEGTCISSPERMSSQMDGQQFISSASPLQDFTLDHTETHQNTSLNNSTHFRNPSSNITPTNNFSILNTTDGNWSDKNGEEDQEDPTLTSLLVTDYSALHRRLTILSKSFMKNTSVVSGDQSFNDATLNVDKLQARLAHLERIILMQKEEITVYESLLTSMGVPVLTSGIHQMNGANGASEDSKESLLRQHLVEIRKLRQRLENLDLSNDPDQLLIFHTHTQQRITQQEHTISKLQQTLVEKEETWNREFVEKEHRLSREKAMLEQRLDVTQEELKNQRLTLSEQEKVINNLKENLQLKDQVKREIEEDNEKLRHEKEEISEDLVKREKEFLDMEKTMFKLELAKEEVESQKTTIKAELEENEKQVMKLKCDVDHYKESCRGLREALKHKEESLHEQVQCLKKMAQEKTGMDEKMARLQVELEEMKAEAENMKFEVDEKRQIEEDFSQLSKEFYELRNMLDQKLGLHKQVLNSKEELEAELSRLNDDMSRERADNEERIQDLRKTAEIELRKKQQELGEEVANLRSTLDKRRNLESELRMRVTGLESNLRKEELDRAKLMDELHEKTEKVSKRDRQCQFVLDRFGKLEAAYKKQSQVLKDKNEAVNSLKKQLQMYESTLSRLSKDTEQGTLQELFHELMLTKSQVASLLARIEAGGANQAVSLSEINLETLGTITDSCSNSTTTTSSSQTITSTETTTLQTSTVNSCNTTTSELFSLKAHHGGSLTDLTSETGMGMSSASLDNPHHSLWAILKLEQHEKVSMQTGECLVSLSGVEARIEDRLKAYKAKSVTESLDYSTLREAGIACHQMRTCLNDVSRIISLAWITELPSVKEQDKSCDLETEKLRGELTQLQSKYSILQSTVKEQQGKLNVSKQRQKDWEHSVCRQLLRTSHDLEQAKENLDLSQGILKQVNISANANRHTEGNFNVKTGGESGKKNSRPSLQHEMN